MFATPENFSSYSATTLDAALQFARISLNATERLFTVGMDAGRDAASEAAKLSKDAGDVKTFQDFIAAQTKTAEASVEKAIGLSKTFYEVVQQAQKEASSIVEAKMSEFSKVMTAGIDQALKSAPPGADAAVAAIKSAMATSTAAFDSVTKAAKQAASMAEANVQAVVESAAPRAKTAKAK